VEEFGAFQRETAWDDDDDANPTTTSSSRVVNSEMASTEWPPLALLFMMVFSLER